MGGPGSTSLGHRGSEGERVRGSREGAGEGGRRGEDTEAHSRKKGTNITKHR